MLFFIILSRFIGFFLLSPLFSQKAIPIWVRAGLGLICSFLLLPLLTVKFTVSISFSLVFMAELIKELAIGYLIGFLFSLLFEAASFAGQVVATMTGFSATELLDPIANSRSPLFSRFFVFTLFALFLVLDLHHLLIRLLYDSYLTFPPTLTTGMIEATSRLFAQAISYAFYPLTLLFIVIVGFGIIARFFPALQIFWTGFAIQLLIGIIAIALAIGFFSPILHNAFHEFWTLAKKVFFPL